MGKALYWCVRQRAGPLIKECRALRPRLRSDDAAWARTQKQEILRPRLTAVSRRPADRLELRLATFGWSGVFYTLTYGDSLPGKFLEVRRDLRNFLGRAKRFYGGGFDYAYCIEGKHGDRRWHVHLILRDDFPSGEIGRLWRNGLTFDEPLLRDSGGFRRIAEYLNKERRGGCLPVGGHPWSVSRSVLAQIPPPERWRDECGEIAVPADAAWRGPVTTVINDFGEYRFASWIEARGTGATS